VAGTAALSTVAIAAPFVRGAYAAGKLSVGFWDHWVPNANGATEKLIKDWAEKEKVDIQIDFITSQGNKLLLTTAAESQAKSGHDILAMNTFLPARYSEQLLAEVSAQGHRRGVARHGLAEVDQRPVGREGPAEHPALGLADRRGFDRGQPRIGKRDITHRARARFHRNL
jgi:hypothetical protein